jgi:putative sigma-54 modulation protein
MGVEVKVKITIRGKNAQVTDALKGYVEKRLTKLTRYFDSIQEAQVTVSTVGDNYAVEVTIPLNNGMILRGEDMSRENFYEAVDLVSEKLERQVRKHRTKLYRKFRHQGLKTLIMEMGEDDKKEDEPTIVKTKRFLMKPMPVEEAILQLNLLGHDFFVFSNAETEQVNVLYKRKDGNYGLIEPEL